MMAQEAKGGQSCHSFPMSITDLRQLQADMHEDTLTKVSSFSTTSLNEERHVHFNNEVMQCAAVEAKDGNKENDCMPHLDKEDQVVGSNGKNIAHLPPTRLNYHIDLSESPSETTFNQWLKSSPSKPAPTVSMDTMPHLHAPANLLLDDGYDDDDSDDANLDFATASQLALILTAIGRHCLPRMAIRTAAMVKFKGLALPCLWNMMTVNLPVSPSRTRSLVQ
jgi:hypothetical protein